jgi:hypothetical protein
MPDDRPLIQNCDEKVEALDAADRLISRLQDKVAEQLPPDSNIDPEDAYAEIIGELETAPEIEEVRDALGRNPDRFGSAEG